MGYVEMVNVNKNYVALKVNHLATTLLHQTVACFSQ